MAESAPPDPVVLPHCSPALLMDRQTTAVWNRAVLSAPDTDSGTALRTIHEAASRETNIVLLDGSRVVVTRGDVAAEDQFQPH